MQHNKLFGYEREKMPGIEFRMMSLWLRIYYYINPQKKYLSSFGIKPGTVVVDYGCGPGGYIKWASEAAGPDGKVYAVDIHKLAIKSVKRLISGKKLQNVIPVLAKGYSCEIEDNTVDMIYAVDMFHMVEDIKLFLDELHRIIKKGGVLILEDGHQARELSIKKVKNTGGWVISEENKRHMRCIPVK